MDLQPLAAVIYCTCNWRASHKVLQYCSQAQATLLHAQERQAGKDQAQEAAAELLRDMAEDDTQQEPWQPPGADASPRASWHLAGGFDADDFEDASAELDDDLPDADYVVCSIPVLSLMACHPLHYKAARSEAKWSNNVLTPVCPCCQVPHVAGPFSFQGLHAATAKSQPAQPDSSPVPPMSESQSPASVSDQDEWAAAAAAADAAPLDADFEGPTSMSRSSSFEEPEFWSPVYGAAAQPDSDPSPAAEDSVDAASAAGAAAANGEQNSSSSAAVQPPAASGAPAAANAVDRPDPVTQSEDAPVSHAMDAELVARLAALSRRQSSASHSTATSPATVAAAAPTPAAASSGSDLAQVLQEAEARFLVLGGGPQRAGPGAPAASAAPRQAQAQPQQGQQPDGLAVAADNVLDDKQLVSHRLEAGDDGAGPAAAAEVSSAADDAAAAEVPPAADDAAALAKPAADVSGAAPKLEVPSSQAANDLGAQDADTAELEPDGVAAGSSPDHDEARADQHAAPPQQPAGGGGHAAAEAGTVTVLQQQLSPLQRQETGSGSFSFSFPAPAAIAAAAIGTSPREPPTEAVAANTEPLEAARSDGRADQPADQRSREEPEQAAANNGGMTAIGDTEAADIEPLSAAASDASAEQPAHQLSREKPEQAASNPADSAAAAGEQAMPQPDEAQPAPVAAAAAAVPDEPRAASPAADSPSTTGQLSGASGRNGKLHSRPSAR
jgi:hypothetical protein